MASPPFRLSISAAPVQQLKIPGSGAGSPAVPLVTIPGPGVLHSISWVDFGLGLIGVSIVDTGFGTGGQALWPSPATPITPPANVPAVPGLTFALSEVAMLFDPNLLGVISVGAFPGNWPASSRTAVNSRFIVGVVDTGAGAIGQTTLTISADLYFAGSLLLTAQNIGGTTNNLSLRYFVDRFIPAPAKAK